MSAIDLSPSPQAILRPAAHNGATAGQKNRTESARVDTSLRLDGPDEGVATLIQAKDSLNRVGGAFIAVTSNSLTAMFETGTLVGRLMTEMSKNYMDSINYTAITYAGLGRDCLACRTSADVVDLQKKAIEAFTETYESASKVYSDLFEAFSTAFEPLMVRSADAPERMFRAFAD
jgi:hypothetical protein